MFSIFLVSILITIYCSNQSRPIYMNKIYQHVYFPACLHNCQSLIWHLQRTELVNFLHFCPPNLALPPVSVAQEIILILSLLDPETQISFIKDSYYWWLCQNLKSCNTIHHLNTVKQIFSLRITQISYLDIQSSNELTLGHFSDLTCYSQSKSPHSN